jgi:rhodanese-related sulfurtransferase
VPAAVILGACLAGTLFGADHTRDTPDAVRKALEQKKAILIDVRELSEWDEGHLRDARLLPLSELQDGLDEKKLASTLDKQKVIYLHCRSGRRCLTAADILAAKGYKVRALKPGYKDLLEAGFPKAK